MIKRFSLIQIVVTLLFCGAAVAVGTVQQSVSVLVGGLLILANIDALIWSWRRILVKKSVALGVAVIVFKYAILAALIFYFLGLKQISQGGFIIGLLTLLPSLLVFSLKERGFAESLKG